MSKRTKYLSDQRQRAKLESRSRIIADIAPIEVEIISHIQSEAQAREREAKMKCAERRAKRESLNSQANAAVDARRDNTNHQQDG